jgi:hypothetical protein
MMSWKHFWDKKKKEEEQMTKKTVKFTYTDGKKVTKGADTIFNLRSPLALNVSAKTKIQLGVKCDHPLMVFENVQLKNRGITISSGCGIYDAGDEIIITLSADKTSGAAVIDFGEVIARAFVLDSSDVQEV